MNAKVVRQEMYRLVYSGKTLGLYTEKQLYEMRNAIDLTLRKKTVHYETNLIINEVCAKFGLERTEIFSKRRPERIVWPRQIAICLLREFTGLSLNELGLLFGGKHNATILHAIRLVQARRNMETQGAAIRSIEKALSKSCKHRLLSESIPASNGHSEPVDANGHGSGMDSV